MTPVATIGNRELNMELIHNTASNLTHILTNMLPDTVECNGGNTISESDC
jgi:hypothetical protein